MSALSGGSIWRSVLFLDFDGVLNSRQWFLSRGGDTKLLRIERDIDPRALAEVQRIVSETGCNIVISSTWRILHSLERLREILIKHGLNAYVEGVTPDHGRSHGRGLEIQAYLDANPADAFAILDDDSDMHHLAPQLVLTKFEYGLTSVEADRVISMLRRKAA